MIKIAFLILAIGVFFLFLGYRNSNPQTRKFGLYLFIVGTVLILLSNFTEISVFPEIN